MKKFILEPRIILFLLLAVAIFVPTVVFGQTFGSPDRGYPSFYNSIRSVILNSGSHSNCSVKNSTSYSFFIPTKYDTGWNSLVSSAPITVGGGTLVAGCCGDGNCQSDLNEDCASCASDCGACAPYCGDGICNNGETTSTCFYDCGVGCCQAVTVPPPGGACDATNSDACTIDFSCEWTGSYCQSKPPVGNCWSYTSFSSCEINNYGGCSWDATAQPCNHFCGDGICSPEIGESFSDCSADCSSSYRYCGDGTCDAGLSENCSTCASDCGACSGCGDGICSSSETCSSCAVDCNVCSPTGSCCTAGGNVCAGSACFGKDGNDCLFYSDCVWLPGQI